MTTAGRTSITVDDITATCRDRKKYGNALWLENADQFALRDRRDPSRPPAPVGERDRDTVEQVGAFKLGA